MDTSRLLAIIRSKSAIADYWRKFAAAGDDGKYSRDLQFVSSPIGDHLLLICVFDHGETYDYIDVEDLKPTGLTPEEALAVAWENTLAQIGEDAYFEQMPEFGWMPSTAGQDECVSLFVHAAAIRALPLAGRPVAFVPNTRGFWIMGSDDVAGDSLVFNIVQSEFQNTDARFLTPLPMVMDDNNEWQRWMPPPDHPAYVRVCELETHYLQNGQLRSPAELGTGLAPTTRNAAGRSTGLMIAIACIVAMLVIGVTGVGMFLGYRLIATPNVPQSQLPPIATGRAIHEFKAVAPQFAPLPPFEELGEAEQLLPALAEPSHKVITPQIDPEPLIAFDDEPPAGWVVGMRVTSGNDWGGVVRSLQPIYLQEREYRLGEVVGDGRGHKQAQLLAKPGYAVSGISLQRGLVVNAIRLTYSRVVENHLDLTDSYASDWFGVDDGREVLEFSSYGAPIIGLAGNHDGNCFGWLALNVSLPRPVLEYRKMLPVEWTPIGDFPELGESVIELPELHIATRTIITVANSPLPANLRVAEQTDGVWLVGLRVNTGTDWGGVICAVQPIYQTGTHYGVGQRVGVDGVRQTQVLAKPGYAVAKLELQRGLVVNAIRLTFAKVHGTHLDLTDSYTTAWLGNADERAAEFQSSDAHPVIGLATTLEGTCFQQVRLEAGRVEHSKVE